MSIPPKLPHILALAPFSVADARAAGVAYARLRRADLESPFHGVRSTERQSGMVERCVAYAPRLRSGQCFSHVSAAALWGIWLPARVLDQSGVDVLALSSAQRPRVMGVRGRRARAASLGFARGYPVTSPAQTWLDLGSLLSVPELVAAGDSIVRREEPLGSLDDLVRLARDSSSRPGIVSARRALPHVRCGADSPEETRLRLLVFVAGLPEPEVNGAIILRSGENTPGDLVFRRWKVLAEYDGKQHRVSARQFERDIARLEALAGDGWIVVRVIAPHFAEPAVIVDRIVRALRARGWRGRVSRGQLLREPFASP